jgi:hypothetical protein
MNRPDKTRSVLDRYNVATEICGTVDSGTLAGTPARPWAFGGGEKTQNLKEIHAR